MISEKDKILDSPQWGETKEEKRTPKEDAMWLKADFTIIPSRSKPLRKPQYWE